jgi:acyl-CoA reductase-like NAD-dependent aldehyde dehydrogenase
MREFSYFYAPNINSYKRFQPGSFAPTAIAWGRDNRTCALRVVGHGAGLRMENRVPGGDVNPYLAVGAMLAGGLHGIENELKLEPAFVGNAYAADVAHVPTTLAEARDLLAGSAIARAAFGDDVVDHYVNAPTSRSAPSMPPSRTGNASVASSGSETHERKHLMSTTHDVINPATEEVVTTLDLVGVEETDAAIAKAVEVGPAWRAVSPADRGMLLRRFADVVEEHTEELARLEVTNAGHTIGNARWEAGNVVNVLRYYSAAPERLFGRQIPVAGGLDVTFKEPLGVVSVIVPWNFPMPIAGWGFAPALAAGNTVVLKPAELTPLTAIRLGELALQAGLPEGVFTILPGKGSVVGERFVTHPDVRKVCFTGSTAVGQGIMRKAADQLKRVTLELGGKSANIVFADADVEKAAASAPMSFLDNAGQDCCARTRILVQRRVYDAFMERFEAAIRAVRVGDPGDESTEMGPMVSSGQRDTVRSFVEDAEATGHAAPDIAFRGAAPEGKGWWYPPTVLMAHGTDDRAWREEIFGPVVSVMPFDDEADAIAKANDTAYGLSGSIWTRDVGRAIRVSRAVEAGNLSVNSHSSVRYSTPFGGFKASGIGRELGPDALDAFTETKNVFFDTQA